MSARKWPLLLITLVGLSYLVSAAAAQKPGPAGERGSGVPPVR